MEKTCRRLTAFAPGTRHPVMAASGLGSAPIPIKFNTGSAIQFFRKPEFLNSGRPQALLQQPQKFHLFGQEGVVPVRADHLPVIGLDAGRAN